MEAALAKLCKNTCMELMEALDTLLVYTRNLIHYPDEKKYRKVKNSNIHYQERLGHLPGAEEAMRAIGYFLQGEFLRVEESVIKNPAHAEELLKIEKKLAIMLDETKRQFAALPTRLGVSHVYTSVAGAGAHSEVGKRPQMEDDEIMVDGFNGNPKQGFFGLYDGHGGRGTVDYVVKTLHLNLQQQLQRNPSVAFADAFREAYLATDGQLRRQNILRSGSTSVTCVISVTDDGRRILFTANVGDSRAVLCRGGKAIRLTIDHKASLPEEAKRIQEAGGFIGRNKRVNGVLAISRALGDHMLKENDVVTAVPYASETELTSEDTFLILACDGLWDVMTDQQAVDMAAVKIREYQSKLVEAKSSASDGKDAGGVAPAVDESDDTPTNLNDVLRLASKAMVKEAIEVLRSLDNVTCMIIQL